MSSIDASAITDGIDGIIQGGKGILGNPLVAGVVGAVVGGAVVGTTIAGISAIKKSSARKSSSRRRKTSSKRGHSHRGKSHKSGRHTSHKRIHYTKNKQPYIILASGKARFIKKSSAKNSRKRKGGRY
jgi:hypothetical protein